MMNLAYWCLLASCPAGYNRRYQRASKLLAGGNMQRGQIGPIDFQASFFKPKEIRSFFAKGLTL